MDKKQNLVVGLGVGGLVGLYCDQSQRSSLANYFNWNHLKIPAVSNRLLSSSLWMINWTCWICSFMVLKWTTLLSIQTMNRSLNTSFKAWITEGALNKTHGIIPYSQCPDILLKTVSIHQPLRNWPWYNQGVKPNLVTIQAQVAMNVNILQWSN